MGVASNQAIMLSEEDRQSILDELERVETKLLTVFQQPVDLRVRSHAARIRAMDAEMEPSQSG
jgi:hypothetical protein